MVETKISFEKKVMQYSSFFRDTYPGKIKSVLLSHAIASPEWIGIGVEEKYILCEHGF